MEAHASKNPVDPSIPNTHGHKAKDKRSNWHAQREHDCPDAHEPGSFLAEETLRHHGAAKHRGWTNKEGCDGSTQSLGCEAGAYGTANVANQAASKAEEEYGPPPVHVGKRSPEERSAAEDDNDEGG